MKTGTKEKVVVLAVSFALFVGGVSALSMDRGSGRTAILTVAILGLLSIAVRQTIRNSKKKKG